MINHADEYLINDIKEILDYGFMDQNPRPKYADGSPAFTYSVNHNVRKYNLEREFPISNLRPIAWKNAIKEILWIYQDESNDLNLLENKYGIKWWRDWESKYIPNTIGNRYGHTINRYNIFKKRVLEDIEKNPYGRYHIVNLWQEEELSSSDGLNPCAYETIWNVRRGYLDMMLIQRSGDMLVASGGGQINEVQYAALLIMTARHLGYTPGIFTHVVANEQIYERHIDNAREIIKRYTKLYNKNNQNIKSPRLILDPRVTNFYECTIDDFTMENYEPITPQLKFDLGV